jgi:hypothetical protein
MYGEPAVALGLGVVCGIAIVLAVSTVWVLVEVAPAVSTVSCAETEGAIAAHPNRMPTTRFRRTKTTLQLPGIALTSTDSEDGEPLGE